jgi:hypothetical protein
MRSYISCRAKAVYRGSLPAAFFVFVTTLPAQAALLSFTFDDTAGDPRDRTDVTQIDVQFDNVTGDYLVKATADSTNPFHGTHLLYLSAFNPDVGTTEPGKSSFGVSRFAFVAETPTTMVSRSGTSSVLTYWKAGDRVASYEVLGRPDGSPPEFQSVLGGNRQAFTDSDEIRDVAVIVAVPEPTTLYLAVALLALFLALRFRSAA